MSILHKGSSIVTGTSFSPIGSIGSIESPSVRGEKQRAKKVIKIGLLGSGIVGNCVQNILLDVGRELKEQLALSLEIEKIYTRSPQKKPLFGIMPTKFTTDPKEVINNRDVSIVVEALGLERPEDGRQVANYLIESLKKGKSVVTANKAVLASYGEEIYNTAKEMGKELRFEATVAGGIPIIRSLGEGLLPDHVNQLYGILNGTCNYILSSISNQGKTFESALKEAQRFGYAETDPTTDIKGLDTKNKLIILIWLIFGIFVKQEDVATEGIDHLERVDFDYARHKLHSNIKLLGYVRRRDKEVVARVSPIMMKDDHILARIDGALNAILVDSKYCETMCFVGKGAGAGPTANSVVSDVISIAMGHHIERRPLDFRFNKSFEEQDENRYYIRFVVKDRPGIVSEILGYLKDNKVNVDEVLQLKHSQEEKAYFQKKFGFKGAVDEILPFILTVGPCREASVRKAIEEIRRQDFLLTGPVVIKMLPNLPDVVTH